MIGQGRAILVYQSGNEQGLAFRVHGHHWKPVDFEGVSLMLRPPAADRTQWGQTREQGSSTAISTPRSRLGKRNQVL